jgi:hypothetical protein
LPNCLDAAPRAGGNDRFTLRLLHSGTVLTEGTLYGACSVCNYFLDSLRADFFRARIGRDQAKDNQTESDDLIIQEARVPASSSAMLGARPWATCFRTALPNPYYVGEKAASAGLIRCARARATCAAKRGGTWGHFCFPIGATRVAEWQVCAGAGHARQVCSFSLGTRWSVLGTERSHPPPGWRLMNTIQAASVEASRSTATKDAFRSLLTSTACGAHSVTTHLTRRVRLFALGRDALPSHPSDLSPTARAHLQLSERFLLDADRIASHRTSSCSPLTGRICGASSVVAVGSMPWERRAEAFSTGSAQRLSSRSLSSAATIGIFLST